MDGSNSEIGTIAILTLAVVLPPSAQTFGAVFFPY